MHVFELARRLIEIESITENEKRVAFFLKEYLSGLKYDVSLQESASDRFNVTAFAGKPDLVFTSQIKAAERLRAQGETRLGMLFVVGEERNSVGALAANRTPPGSGFFIDGEPTENRLAAGSKGSLRAEIGTRGKAAHSAYPQAGESAILKLLDLLQEVRAMELPRDAVLGETTCNIGILEGGTKPNIIPDRARAEVMFRSVEPIDRLKARLEAVIHGRAEVRYPFEVPPVMMNVAEGFETTVVAFTSDVPFLTQWGKAYMMGPGSILDAHTDHERISKKQLLERIDLNVQLDR